LGNEETAQRRTIKTVDLAKYGHSPVVFTKEAAAATAAANRCSRQPAVATPTPAAPGAAANANAIQVHSRHKKRLF